MKIFNRKKENNAVDKQHHNIVSLGGKTDFRGVTPLEPETVNYAQYGISTTDNTELVISGAIEDDTINYREPLIQAVFDLYEKEMSAYEHNAQHVKEYIDLGIENQIKIANMQLDRIGKLQVKEAFDNE